MIDLHNIFMVATMLPLIVPFWVELKHGDVWLATLIACSGLASALYHLHESQKHCLCGLSGSPLNLAQWNWILINFVRFFAVCLFMIKLVRFEELNAPFVYTALLALAIMSVSETVYRYERNGYIVTHTAWHILVAVLLLLLV